jgi:hypothetical protein
MSATTYDLTAGLDGKLSSAAPAALNVPGPVLFKLRVSMPLWVAKKGVAAFVGSSSDVLQLVDIPAGTFVHACWVQLITPEGATAAGTLGDATQAAGFVATITLNGTALTFYGPVGSEAYAAYGGKFYDTADTLDIVLATAAAIETAVFDLYVLATFSA